MQLLYWPVGPTTASSNVTMTNSTAPRNSTRLVTATYDGTVLTSPSVYISFATVYAENACNTTVGTPRTGSILGMNPADLSSALGNYHAISTLADTSGTTALSMVALPFDFSDLNWPYNPYAWEEQPRCNEFIAEICPVIMKGSYDPVLVVPSQVRNLDPAWASCALDWQGMSRFVVTRSFVR